MAAKKKIISAHDIVTYIRLDKNSFVHCVDGVDLEIYDGEVFGLVGESGSGKTMLALSIMGLIGKYPGVVNGKVEYIDQQGRRKSLFSENGNSPDSKIFQPTIKQFRAKLKRQNRSYRDLRGSHLSLIFQDPQTSLNPYLKIGHQLAEVIRKASPELSKTTVRKEAINWLRKVRIREPHKWVDSYSHQLSGGMGQRVMIAIALASKPRFIVADEPTTGLDVTNQSKIMDLFKNIKEETGLTFLLISHDLGMIAQLADRMGVMYCGKMLELGPVKDILNLNQRHPYTSGLLSSLPKLGQRYQNNRLIAIPEDAPSSTNPPSGCRFHPRCQARQDGLISEESEKHEFFKRCVTDEPPFFKIKKDYFVRCWLYSENPRLKKMSVPPQSGAKT